MPGSSPGMIKCGCMRAGLNFEQQASSHTSAISPRTPREFCHHIPPKKQRAQGMPGARRARSLVCENKKHTSIVTTVVPETPDIPRATVYGLSSCSPRRSGFLVTVAGGLLRRLDAGVEASGPHDFAVRASAARLEAPPASIASRIQRP